MRGLNQAASLADVRRSFFAWYNEWIDADGWDPAGEREFQAALEVLGDLIGLEQRLGLAPSSPVRVFLELLQGKLYLQAGGRGIPVYPYRVAAGGCVQHHFVLNLHQDGVEVLSGGVSFLREDQQEALELAVQDMTLAFLQAYASYGSDEVWFSGNHGIRGGVHAVPAVYLDHHDLVQELDAGPGLEQREQQWWADPDAAVPGLPLHLVSGLRHCRAVLPDRHGCNMIRQSLRDAGEDEYTRRVRQLLQAAVTQRYCPEGNWTVSAASLRSMTANPAAVLLQRVLGLEDGPWEPDWQMALDVGNLYHQALEILLDPQGALAAADHFDPGILERELHEVVQRLRRGFIPFRTRLTELEIEAELAVMQRTLQELVPFLDPGLDGAGLAAVEHEIRQPDSEFGMEWKGRIDRLDRVPADGSVIVYDYKRRRVPTAGELRPLRLDDSDPFPIISEPQMAVYLRWAHLTGQEVAGARFVSLTDAQTLTARKVKHVVLSSLLLDEVKEREGRKPRLMEEYQDPECGALFAALHFQTREYLRRFQELDFSIPPERTRFQQDSSFRQVTRHRYRVR